MAEIRLTATAPDAGASIDQAAGFGGEARTGWQTVLRRFLRHRLAMVSVALFGTLVLAALVLPLFYPYSYEYTGGRSFEDPTGTHLLGTNQIGADMGAQVLRGTQFSLLIALVVAFMATTIGVTLGALAGFLRGPADTLISRVTDLFLIFPLLAVAAILINLVGGSWYLVALVLGAFSWMQVARINRGETLSLAEREFVEAARALGASTPRIVFRHILPNLTGTIVVNATLAVATAVLAEAALSFLTLGVQPPDTSLGLVIQQNYAQFGTRPWLFWPAFTVLVLISLSINFIGDGLRDAFDPRQSKVRA